MCVLKIIAKGSLFVSRPFDTGLVEGGHWTAKKRKIATAWERSRHQRLNSIFIRTILPDSV